MAAVLMRMSSPPKWATVSRSATAIELRSRMSTAVAAMASLPAVTRASCATASAPAQIAVGDHDVRSALGREQSSCAADAAGSADDERDLPAEFLLRGLAANLRVFQHPVLDAKRFRGGQRDIVGVDLESFAGSGGSGLRHIPDDRCTGERACALHHVNGVGVELADDARLRLALAKGKHADAGNQHHGWIGIAHGRRRRDFVLVVVRGVFRAIGFEGCVRSSFAAWRRCPPAAAGTNSGRILVRIK